MRYVDGHNTITVQTVLATGGEGTICTINEDHRVVLKLLHHPNREAGEKIAAMIAAPPRHPGITFPLRPITNTIGAHVGHLMNRVRCGVPLSLLFNPAQRRTVAPGFTWDYLVVLAANVASLTMAMHDHGYVIGDLSDNNFLGHKDATATLIDTDSAQVPRRDRTGYFRCIVGTEDYTPPELHGLDFASIDRSPFHDNFALAVLLFSILMDGNHPFAGRWHAPGDPPTRTEKIRHGLWPYDQHAHLVPPPSAPPLTILPPRIQSLFRRCFIEGHRQPTARPTAKEWHEQLTTLGRELRTCDRNYQHKYSNHLAQCPWCERTRQARTNGFRPSTTTLPNTPHHAGAADFDEVDASLNEVLDSIVPLERELETLMRQRIATRAPWPFGPFPPK